MNKHRYCWHTMAWLYMYMSSLMVNFLNTACHLKIPYNPGTSSHSLYVTSLLPKLMSSLHTEHFEHNSEINTLYLLSPFLPHIVWLQLSVVAEQPWIPEVKPCRSENRTFQLHSDVVCLLCLAISSSKLVTKDHRQ